jgi:hypothetical protein
MARPTQPASVVNNEVSQLNYDYQSSQAANKIIPDSPQSDYNEP